MLSSDLLAASFKSKIIIPKLELNNSSHRYLTQTVVHTDESRKVRTLTKADS